MHPARPGTGWTPTLTVGDFDRTVAALRQHGVAFDADEDGADEGYRLVRILDPEGNPVGIAPRSPAVRRSQPRTPAAA